MSVTFIAPLTFKSVPQATNNHCVRLKQSAKYNRRRNQSCAHNICMQTGENSDDETFNQLTQDIRIYLESAENQNDNPLAYDNLRKAGRIDLISRIMDAGGYIEVSERLSIPVDESRFTSPPPKENKQLFTQPDNSASLVVGTNLQRRLDEISNVSALGDEDDQLSETKSKYSDSVPSAEQLRRESENMAAPVVDEPVPEGELFVLTASMRVGMLLPVSLGTIGFGRTSVGLVDPDVMHICQGLVFGLVFAHVIIAIYAGAIQAPKLNRNGALWSLKVLLSGPIGLTTLRALPALDNSR